MIYLQSVNELFRLLQKRDLVTRWFRAVPGILLFLIVYGVFQFEPFAALVDIRRGKARIGADDDLHVGPNRSQRFDEVTLTRQCDWEYLDQIADRAGDYDAVLSTACGAGVQFLAERYPDTVVLPALDTRFIGVALGAGEWQQRCNACADCVLDQTGGICPKTMCAKGLVNGPCGGTNHGKCEVNPETDCAWTLIYERLKRQGRLDLMRGIAPLKRYRPSTHPGRFQHMAYKRLDEEGVR